MSTAHTKTTVRSGTAGAKDLFRLGMMYSTGASVPADMVSAHKWFNIAALRGDAEAARLRREIAEEMSEAERNRPRRPLPRAGVGTGASGGGLGREVRRMAARSIAQLTRGRRVHDFPLDCNASRRGGAL